MLFSDFLSAVTPAFHFHRGWSGGWVGCKSLITTFQFIDKLFISSEHHQEQEEEG